MRYRSGQKEETRARLVTAVGRGFRKKGFGGIGVDGLAREAGMTSGAFYGHFKSKRDAFAAALKAGLDDVYQGVLATQREHGREWLLVFAQYYLTAKRTCDLSESCALQSLTGDVARQSRKVRDIYKRSFDELVTAVATGLEGGSDAVRRQRAAAILCTLAGAVTMSRANPDPAVGEMIAAGALDTIARLQSNDT